MKSLEDKIKTMQKEMDKLLEENKQKDIKIQEVESSFKISSYIKEAENLYNKVTGKSVNFYSNAKFEINLGQATDKNAVKAISLCKLSATKLMKILIKYQTSLDLGETQSYIVSYLDPSCLTLNHSLHLV